MSDRAYAGRPLVCVGASILEQGRLLLVQRRFDPKAGCWTLPGGMVELGESVQDAVVREVREECGIQVTPIRLLDVIDFIEKDEDGSVRYHYVLVDFEAQWTGGEVEPQSDVADARWFVLSDLQKVSLPKITRKFLHKHYGVQFPDS